MKHKETAINHFFDIQEIPRERLSAMVKSDEFKPIKEEISKELKGVTVPNSFFEKVIQEVSELLNIDTRAILIGAWGAATDILKYVQSDASASDDVVLIPLVKHTISSKHQPSLKPYVNQVPIANIQFTVTLKLALKGVILKLQKGKITEITIGACQGSGEIKYGEHTLLKKEADFPELLGTVQLGDGISLKEPVEKVHEKLIGITGEEKTAQLPAE